MSPFIKTRPPVDPIDSHEKALQAHCPDRLDVPEIMIPGWDHECPLSPEVYGERVNLKPVHLAALSALTPFDYGHDDPAVRKLVDVCLALGGTVDKRAIYRYMYFRPDQVDAAIEEAERSGVLRKHDIRIT